MTHMLVTVTVRPGARTEVRGLPWTGKPQDTYEMLEDMIGATRRGQVKYDKQSRSFSVARSHTVELINGLVERFGKVHVVQYGGAERCVEACWNARPDTAWTCECSCAGRNHGTRSPLGKIVSETGGAGALSVAASAPHEYVVER